MAWGCSLACPWSWPPGGGRGGCDRDEGLQGFAGPAASDGGSDLHPPLDPPVHPPLEDGVGGGLDGSREEVAGGVAGYGPN